MSLQTAKRALVFYLLVAVFLVACGRSEVGDPTATHTGGSRTAPTDTAEAADTDTPEATSSPTETAAIADAAESASAPAEPPTNQPPVANLPTPTLFDTAWDDRSIFAAGLIAAEQAVLEGLPGASIYHLDIQIEESLRLLQGQEEVRYTNPGEVALDEIYFHFFPNYLAGVRRSAILRSMVRI